jgi:hypothetical protein
MHAYEMHAFSPLPHRRKGIR